MVKNVLTERLVQKMKDVFSQINQVKAVYLFGSRIKGYDIKSSDLDLAIVVDKKEKISLRQILSIFNKENIDFPFELDISIVDLSSSPLFLFQIIKKGKCIYSQNPLMQTELESKIMHIFYDTQHMRDIYHQYLDESMKKGTYGY